MRNRLHLRPHVRRSFLTVLGVATVIPAAALVDTVHAAVPSTNVFPIANSGAACTNSYGDPRSGGRSHAGVDCFSPAGTGTPLVAVESGVIDRRYPHDPSNPCGRGNAVAIRGNSGTRYYYGHLNRIDVALSQRVTRGQRIGTLGQTGNANPACGGGGPHLHFELRPDGTNTVDPYPYVTTWPKVGSGPADRYQPIGHFDVAAARGGGGIGLYGWTFDRDTTTRPALVHVYVKASNGVRTLHVLNANTSRPDVGLAYPGVGDYHGWEVVIGGLPRGSTMIQAYGIDTSNRPNDYTELGTRWVNVT